MEPGAAPYKNWNERIYSQCYHPNAMLGNFERMSFNMGPTLLEWMFDFHPDTESLIVSQDNRSVELNGCGNAMAQAYNHTILPLASYQDKVTQVRWGIRDFQHRFGHPPLGMWLPETAANDETLTVLADAGIQYTILAPWQADTVRLDTSQAYRVLLPERKELSVFFYDQDLSTRISFDPSATVNADRFVAELIAPKFQPEGDAEARPELIMIASDGELYGHHQPFRDKFLAYLLDGAVKNHGIQLTTPAQWLKENSPSAVMEIRQNTSWSCHHGVLRWAGVCNCTPHSEWKAPFRRALDHLADGIDEEYIKVVGALIPDAWELRHQYIRIILGELTLEELVVELGSGRLTGDLLDRLHLLLRAQYERQRMFTSCGWFFDDYDRIEPRNNTAYAAQAVFLTRQATGSDLTDLALAELSKVSSWRSGLRADTVFSKHMRRAESAWGD